MPKGPITRPTPLAHPNLAAIKSPSPISNNSLESSVLHRENCHRLEYLVERQKQLCLLSEKMIQGCHVKKIANAYQIKETITREKPLTKTCSICNYIWASMSVEMELSNPDMWSRRGVRYRTLLTIYSYRATELCPVSRVCRENRTTCYGNIA
ncbi:hypothetical protein EVAR_74985_1 [Eumeta japonica]|uniref:Uncharacterized protein n=1 Tax=Eumeta variegata TaxID=151549 RepID=A0A4C1VAW0_EUMVA|nr:hypothetical protein EVAR_74985_1 [Eumeta japonica]